MKYTNKQNLFLFFFIGILFACFTFVFAEGEYLRVIQKIPFPADETDSRAEKKTNNLLPEFRSNTVEKGPASETKLKIMSKIEASDLKFKIAEPQYPILLDPIPFDFIPIPVLPDPIPIELMPTPILPDPIFIEPIPEPILLDPIPIGPMPDPVFIEPIPIELTLFPTLPDPVPIETMPIPVLPNPIPIEPIPAPILPNPIPIEPRLPVHFNE